MANEIQSSASLSASKNDARIASSYSKALTMAGAHMQERTQAIGFAASETVNFGDITGAPALVLLKNLDATNFVTIGGDSGLTVFTLKILAGEVNLISPSSATMYAQADTAAVNIYVAAVEA